MLDSSANRIAAWISCALCWAATPAARADTVTLSPVADTTLYETTPNNNLGATPNVIAGTTAGNAGQPYRNRALIRFDIADRIPAGAVITAASLKLTVVKIPSVPADSAFELHRLLKSWNEGNKDTNAGEQATTGEATWLSRFFLLPGWTTPGGNPGADFSTNASAATFVTGLGSYTFDSGSNLIADLQFWLDNTNTDFGWMLVSQDEATESTARRFASREDPVNAPTLAIEFVPPPLIGEVSLQNTNLIFHFNVAAGYNYAVEYADAFPATDWLVLTNYEAKVASFEVGVTNSLEAIPGRYYRLSRVPCNCR